MYELHSSDSGLPLTTLSSVILTTGPFVFSWSFLRQYVTKNGIFRTASTIISLNSNIYALFSALLSYLLIQSYLNSQHTPTGQTATATLPFNLTIPLLNKSTLTISDLGLIYHYSKFYEYIDVILLVAQSKVIGPHMAFHHISTPYLTYFRVLNCSGDDWRVFALANTLHHTLMYAYFGGLADWLRIIIPYTGWAQLILGIGTDGLWMYRTKAGKQLSVAGGVMQKTEDEATNRAIAILLLLRYAMLFWNELTVGRAGMSKEERQRLRDAQGKAQEHGIQDPAKNKKRS